MTYTAHDVVDWTAYLFHDEVDALAELSRQLPDHPIVINIGAGNGTSGLAFLQSRDDLHLITVEIQKESSPFGCLEGEWAVFEKADLWPCDRYEWIHDDSKRAGKSWNRDQVDLVFIDGDHSYKGCKADILAWLPHVKQNGLLVVHDYKKEERFAKPLPAKTPHPKAWKGVDKAVSELLIDQYEVVSHIDTLIAFRITHD